MRQLTNKDARRISHETGISFRTIRSRIDRGWTEAELRTKPNPMGRREPFKGSYFGKMLTCRELANISGLDSQTIRDRVKRGKKDHELTKPPLNYKEISNVMLASRHKPIKVYPTISQKIEEPKNDLPFGNSLIGSRPGPGVL